MMGYRLPKLFVLRLLRFFLLSDCLSADCSFHFVRLKLTQGYKVIVFNEIFGVAGRSVNVL